jgi:hypothetical protein
MTSWYVNLGLQKFDVQWRNKFPKATIYHIGDTAHSSNPDVSQHAPDKGGSKPGDNKGEVDAGDYMQGNGVTLADLRELFKSLRDSRDPRILYVILEDKIFSSNIFPWEVRKHTGTFHSHLHISLHDNEESTSTEWKALTVAELLAWNYRDVETARLPSALVFGMDDAGYGGWNHIMRAQALLNIIERTSPSIDCDGVYGAYTTQKVKKLFGGTGKTLTFENLKTLHGFN